MNDRGRIPFALVGVLLLASSAGYVGTLGESPAAEPRVSERMESLTVETQASLKEASRAAATEAAANPVTEQSMTTAGRALNASSAFRDALRIRIYTRARQALDRLETTRRGVTTSATLPTPETLAEIREAKRRVTVSRAGAAGTKLRVEIRNVTLTARRHGRVVGRTVISPSFVLDVPVLPVHDRVRRFERRLDAGPTEPGLGRRLTAGVYPIAWARGYAQYGGAPLENVVANRHIALVTNGAVLDMQQETFGTSDPVGERAHTRALASAALTDVLGGFDNRALRWLKRARSYVAPQSSLPDSNSLATRAQSSAHSASETIRIGINETAADVFLHYVGHLENRESSAVDSLGTSLETRVRNGTGWERPIRETYSARVVRRVNVTELGSHWAHRPGPRPASWELNTTQRQTALTITHRRASEPTLDGRRHLLAHYPRRAVERDTVTKTWDTPDGREVTQAVRVTRYDVDVVLAGDHVSGPAPAGPVASPHSHGGVLNGSNLVGVEDSARRTLVTTLGGPDALARQAVRGRTEPVTDRFGGSPPDRVYEWIYRDLAALRKRVANISITTTRGKVSTFGVNPPARLREKLLDRRSELVDAPARYRGVADRARVAARVAYLEMVAAKLADRAEKRGRRRGAVDDRLSEYGGSAETLSAGYGDRSQRPGVDSPALEMRVDTRPSYLLRASVGHEAVSAIPRGTSGHPLAVRNVNVVSPPYEDVVGAVIEAFLGPKKVPLRVAAQVLRTADQTERRTGASLGRHRDRLRTRVASSVETLRGDLKATLARAGYSDPDRRRAVVERGLAQWESTWARALALTNGSAATAVRHAAIEEWPSMSPQKRDLLGLQLDAAVDAALDRESVKIAEPVTNGTAGVVERTLRGEAVHASGELLKRAGSDLAENATKRGVERLTGKTLSNLPMGVPVAPAPGLWYATVNLWHVDVRGSYAQFVVRVPRGNPVDGGGFRYVRDGSPVRLDVDDDGTRERLGRSSRVRFSTTTDIAIGVPAGPKGVADVNGQAVEESAGWPRPEWK